MMLTLIGGICISSTTTTCSCAKNSGDAQLQTACHMEWDFANEELHVEPQWS